MATSWAAPGTVPALRPGAVQVWRLQSAQVDLTRAHALLNAEERARAARMRAGAAREEQIAARGALRLLLGAVLDRAPQELTLVVGAQGKPSLAGGEVEFNVTHSGGCVLLALSRAGAVGVDIEPIDRAVEATDLAEAHFHPAEVAAIRDVEAGRLALFFRCWTRKEAVVKADGRGLQLPLQSFSVLGDTAREPVQVPGAKALWVQDLPVHPGFAAALAVPDRDASVDFYELEHLL